MRRKKEPELLDLIGAIYDAAIDPEQWEPVMARLALHFRSPSSALVLLDLEAAMVSRMVAPGFDPADLEEYAQHYCEIEPWEQYLKSNTPGELLITEQIVPWSEFRETEYYQDWGKRAGVSHAMGGYIDRDGDRVARIGIQRPARSAWFTEEEKSEFELLVPHLRRAFRLNRHLHSLGDQRNAALELLDRLEQGAVLINDLREAVHLNRVAERMLRAKGALRRQGRFLGAAFYDESEKLGRLIHDAVQTGLGHGKSSGGAMALHGPNGGIPLAVTISPVRAAGEYLTLPGERICAIMLIAEPGTRKPPREDVLQALWGLTPGEAKLASILAEGSTVTDAADTLKITRESARTVLKRIFEKTGTHRQAELVGLMLSQSFGLGGEAWQASGKP